MPSFRKIISYDTTKKAEVIPITKDIEKVIAESKIKNGTLLAYSLHTTLGTIIQEAAEPKLCEDIVDQLLVLRRSGLRHEDDDHHTGQHPSYSLPHDSTPMLCFGRRRTRPFHSI